MINAPTDPSRSADDEDRAVEAILESGPKGALSLAGLATLIVVALWLAFYFIVFLARVTAP
jgi:hypothetical protein